jgi:hypothetical protein
MTGQIEGIMYISRREGAPCPGVHVAGGGDHAPQAGDIASCVTGEAIDIRNATAYGVHQSLHGFPPQDVDDDAYFVSAHIGQRASRAFAVAVANGLLGGLTQSRVLRLHARCAGGVVPAKP